MLDFLFHGNGNAYSICDRLRRYLQSECAWPRPDLWIRPRSNVNMPIESQCRTFYLTALVMFAIVYGIFEIEICMAVILTFRMDQGQM